VCLQWCSWHRCLITLDRPCLPHLLLTGACCVCARRSYHWSLKDSLPKEVQEYLVVLLTEFINAPWKHARPSRLPNSSLGGSQVRVPALPGGLPGVYWGSNFAAIVRDPRSRRSTAAMDWSLTALSLKDWVCRRA
jgi:hypothetical protein